MADTDEDGKYISDYTISILDSHQQLLFEKTIKPSDIKRSKNNVDFNKTQCDNHYYVIIKKNYPVLETFIFIFEIRTFWIPTKESLKWMAIKHM